MHSHKHIEEVKADVDGITDERTEKAADDANEHTEEADGAPDGKDFDGSIAAHKDKAVPINEHDFEDGLR